MKVFGRLCVSNRQCSHPHTNESQTSMPVDVYLTKILPQVNIQFVPSIHNKISTTLKENVNYFSSI